MTEAIQAAQRHYKGSDDLDLLLTKLEKFLDTIEPPLKAEKLAGLDQFHVRGLAATKQLAEIVGIESRMQILDAGSGLGGPSRFLAEAYNCRVTGMDLSPSFVAIARLLAERAGLADQVSYEVGDLLASPYAGNFDLIWTQHVVMNIANRDALYAGFRRVLKPNGKLAFYDVIAADGKPDLYFPVPWASSGETSFLLNEAETRASLQNAGFRISVWNDVTAAAQAWAQQVRPAPGISLGEVMGPSFAEMTSNLFRNIVEERVRLVMAVCV